MFILGLTISISISTTGRYLIGASFEWKYSAIHNYFTVRIYDGGGTNYNHSSGSGYLAVGGTTSASAYKWGYYKGYNAFVPEQLQTIEEITATKTIKLQFRENSSSTLTVKNIVLYAIKLQDSAGSGTVGTTSYGGYDDMI